MKTKKMLLQGLKNRDEKKIYILFYKPKGIVTTVSPLERPNLLDFINIKQKFGYAGRLDKDAEGLVLITNDGQLINRVTHPRYGVHKIYEVKLNKPFSSFKELNEEIIGKRHLNVKLRVLNKAKTRLTVKIHEGKKHIVKWIFRKLGYKVNELKRLRIGTLTIKGLKPGKYKVISKKEAYSCLENADKGNVIKGKKDKIKTSLHKK